MTFHSLTPAKRQSVSLVTPETTLALPTNSRTQNRPKTVFLGMSGGVDSSVSAVLLQEQGYHVVGVYMKNWSKDLPGMQCPWAEDLADAKRVAVQLGIDFQIFDFEAEYKSKVVDYMVSEFKVGHTPNPDVICNQEIKFKLFYEKARAAGADYIATGHYAQTNAHQLLRAVDENKDQTYFLYRITPDAIAHTLFPIGHLQKPAVKALAAEHHLANAYKKESMGVCFVGEVGIKDFLQEYLPSQIGPIVDSDTNQTIGTHDGVIFYTIGQRHGLYLGGGLPYYVVDKNLQTNTLYVSKNLNHPNLWTDHLELRDVIFRPATLVSDQKISANTESVDQKTSNPQLTPSRLMQIEVRLRHRAPLIPATFDPTKNQLNFAQPIKRPASGQSAVFYQEQICLGGGIIS